jgi:tRNA-specific 2-thiouridylase
MKDAIAIALSGGVDSLVAAHLLKKAGRSVFGLHFMTGYEPLAQAAALGPEPGPASPGCRDVTERFPGHPLREMARQLDIPLFLLDCRRPFGEKVVRYFRESYAAGLTPNPCLVCNPAIKFGAVLDFALERGASALATGHYARVTRDGPEGQRRLQKGADPAKDQSYFLAFLTQAQLARAVFPLGALTKEAVRAMAREKGLAPVESDESQDVCFIKGQSYGDFLVRQGTIAPTRGPIEDMSGRVIGEHPGLHRFTIGQRRGINCPAEAPYYVVRMDPTSNRLTVGGKADLAEADCRVQGINWICRPKRTVFEAHTRLRYRHRAQPATVRLTGQGSATVHFHRPQSAVTPGQGAVFYRGEEVLGGGWIEK